MHSWGRLAAGGLGIVGALALAHPAVADSTITVRGTDFPVGTGLAHVGCASPYAAAGLPLTPYVAQGPGTAPLGARSLGFDTGAADAAGPVAYTGSIGDVAAASVSVDAPQGTTGVAWVGYQPPADAGTSRVWFGHAPLAVPAGGWTSVSAPLTAPLTWAQYDTTSGAVLAAGPPPRSPRWWPSRARDPAWSRSRWAATARRSTSTRSASAPRAT